MDNNYMLNRSAELIGARIDQSFKKVSPQRQLALILLQLLLAHRMHLIIIIMCMSLHYNYH